MKTKATIFALLTAALLTSHARAEDPKNIIFFGNSFTQSGGGIQNIIKNIAVSAGHPSPYVVSTAVGGVNLDYHNSFSTAAITSSIPSSWHWDAAVIQEYSTRPTNVAAIGGNVPAFLAATNTLYQSVKNHSPNAKAVMFETWARGPTHSYYPTYFPGPADMQSQLRTSYHTAVNNLNATHGSGTALFAPVGEAFEDANFNLGLYGSDIYHASNKGALLISLVIYGTVYQDQTTSDINLTTIGAGLGLNAQDISYVTGLADGALVPAPSALAPLALGGLLACRRRRR